MKKSRPKKCCDPVDAAIQRTIALRQGKMSPPRPATSTTWVRPAGTLPMPN